MAVYKDPDIVKLQEDVKILTEKLNASLKNTKNLERRLELVKSVCMGIGATLESAAGYDARLLGIIKHYSAICSKEQDTINEQYKDE